MLHGQYTITEYLNSGGFGITYRAKDSLGRPVVIKECFPSILCLRKGTDVMPRNQECATELRKMIGHFVTEAHSLAALQHKNIVHVHQVFEENDTAYMAIDFIDGLDLLDIIEQKPDSMTPEEIVRITKRTLPAIKYIHGKDLLHRDISPDNILIDQSGEPILIDFGAARKKAKSSSRAFSKMRFVKDGYSPQEFYVEGAEQGPYSDLYSFAATIYHLVTGAAPEDGQKRLSALAQKEPDPYIPLAGRFPGYPRGFLAAIDDALVIVPHKRIQSAEDWMNRILPPRSRGEKPKTMPSQRIKTRTNTTASFPKLNQAEAEVRASLKQSTSTAKAGRTGLLLGVASLVLLGGAVAIAFAMMGGEDDAALISEAPAFPVEPPVAAPESPTKPPISDTAEPVAEVTNAEVAAPAPEQPDLPKATPLTMDFVKDGLAALRPVAEPSKSDFASLPALAAEPPLRRPANLRSEPIFLDEITNGLAASRALPPPRPLEQLSNVPPAIALPSVGQAPFTFLAPSDESLGLTVAPYGAPQTSVNASKASLPAVEVAAQLDTTPPAALLPDPTPALETKTDLESPAPSAPEISGVKPAVAAHWDVEMPFESTTVQARNASTIEIGEIYNANILSMSGDWVREGTVIYTFNGEKLRENLSLSGHILTRPSIDPDGFIRATVRYRSADTGRIDRGLLAIPVTRQIALSDGTLLQARVEDTVWVTRVVEPGASDLQAGDRLISERQTEVSITTEVGIETVIEGLVASGASVADFLISRDGEEMSVIVALGTKKGGSNQ